MPRAFRRVHQHSGYLPNWRLDRGRLGAWLVDARGRRSPGLPWPAVAMIDDARQVLGSSIGRALRRVRVDNAAALVQRYLVGSRGNGSLRPHIDSPLVFGKAILSLTLEGVGVLRMARQGRSTRNIKLERGTLFVLTGDARYKWTHELPASGVESQRTALIVQPVRRRFLHSSGRAPIAY